MYLEIFLADFAVFRVFGGISRDFAEIPEFRGSATARNIRGPVHLQMLHYKRKKKIQNPNIVTNNSANCCHISQNRFNKALF